MDEVAARGRFASFAASGSNSVGPEGPPTKALATRAAVVGGASALTPLDLVTAN
ncbi:DUF6053 domain-containing protein [Lysobacter yananisis]|uniref:DUF6053 domain-containing protein n=1 Tax=Lysobacter yananisis TaxID=1003114 RepID=UPI003CE4E18B